MVLLVTFCILQTHPPGKLPAKDVRNTGLSEGSPVKGELFLFMEDRTNIKKDTFLRLIVEHKDLLMSSPLQKKEAIRDISLVKGVQEQRARKILNQIVIGESKDLTSIMIVAASIAKIRKQAEEIVSVFDA